MATLQLVREDDGFDLPRLGVEDGTTFGYFDRWNLGMTADGKLVTDLSDWEARDMRDMLVKDYKSKQIENVLTLPITSAKYEIQPAEGDTGEAEWLKSFWDADPYMGGCRTSLDQIIGLMTSAFYYKRAYFEKIVVKGKGKFEGKHTYYDVAYRPQTTCRLVRDPKSGRAQGFEQEAYYLGPEISRPDRWPIHIKPNRAFVYTHGTRRDPINGTSDLEVAFWAWKTKQKVLMLWLQFLQAVSLPRIVVKGGDQGTANAIAREISRMKSSGVLPLAVPGGPDSVGIDVLDVSGKGAEQFLQAIQWLDQAATQSVLAGFLDLTANASSPGQQTGSYALSKDASDFFLQSLGAKVKEIQVQLRFGLFAPLIRWNFGKDASIPKIVFEPLNDIDKQVAVELLKQAMAAPPGNPVPTSFIAGLAGQVATALGLDPEAMRKDFKDSFDAAAAEAKAQADAEGHASTPPPGGTTREFVRGGVKTKQQIAGVNGALNKAHTVLKNHRARALAAKTKGKAE